MPPTSKFKQDSFSSCGESRNVVGGKITNNNNKKGRINISFSAWPELKERNMNEAEGGNKAYKHYIEYFVATDVISWSVVMLVITNIKKIKNFTLTSYLVNSPTSSFTLIYLSLTFFLPTYLSGNSVFLKHMFSFLLRFFCGKKRDDWCCCPCFKNDGNLKSIKDMRICIIYP